MSTTHFQPRRDLPPLEEPDVKAERRRRIGERAKALMAAGYYTREEVVMISGWVARGDFGLVEIEWLLADAERDLQAIHSVRPKAAA